MLGIYRKGIKYLCYHGYLNWMQDEPYLKLLYYATFNKKLNLKNPVTYNEKLQWLKLYDRNPQYSKMVDKYEAKKYIASILGEEYIIPTLGVWDKFNEIDFDSLPNQFVLKCTHDSGGLVICKNKRKLDIEAARKKINASLKRNYFLQCREWPYKDIKPRIIAEQYMEDSKSKELRDYKFYTFNGIVKYLMINSGRSGGETKADYYDRDFKWLDFTWGYPHSDIQLRKPKSFYKMIECAEKAAKGTTELRVDFYDVDDSIYFGELTFFDGSGFEKFIPDSWDEKFGSLIQIPEKLGGGMA